MAKEEDATEEAESGGGSKKLIIIVAVVVLLVVVGGVGAFLALGGSGQGDEDGEEDFEEDVEEDEEMDAPAAILPLETFIVNLQVKGSFLKSTVQLEFAEPELPPTVESDVPKIRDAIIRVLSGKSSADILTVEGKERLREELRDTVNDAIGAEDVTQVYFTEFIIQ